MKLRLFIVFLLLFFGLLISGGTVYGSPNISVNWKIEPGTNLSFHLDTYENSSLSTVIDEIAKEYDFANLEKNFFGELQLKLNITEIDMDASLTDIVKNFLNFTAPIEVSQILNDSVEKKLSYLPLCVPIGIWDEFKSEFEAKANSCSVEHTGTNEVVYNVNWVFEGQNATVSFIWDDTDGSLQGIFYEISIGSLKDVLILRLSGIETANSINTSLYYSIKLILILGLLFGASIVMLKSRKKSQNISNENLTEVKGFHQIENENKFTLQSYNNSSKMLDEYRRFKSQYLFLFCLFNTLSIGIFITGLYLLKILGNTLENKNLSELVIIGGVIITAISTFLLNIPIYKWNKKLQPQTKEYIIDPSPFLTLIAGVSGFLIYVIMIDLNSIITIKGQILMIFMCVILAGLIGFVYYLSLNKFISRLKLKN